MIQLIGLGAGGHAKVVIEILLMGNRYKLFGLLDPKPELKGKNVLGVPVLGDDNLLPALKSDGVSHFFIGLGGMIVSFVRKTYAAIKRGLDIAAGIIGLILLAPLFLLIYPWSLGLKPDHKKLRILLAQT